MQLWWAFGPGIVNVVGDFLSRNFQDRDEAFGMHAEDEEERLNTTLKQILETVGVKQCARDVAMKELTEAPMKWGGFPETDLGSTTGATSSGMATRGGGGGGGVYGPGHYLN